MPLIQGETEKGRHIQQVALISFQFLLERQNYPNFCSLVLMGELFQEGTTSSLVVNI